MKIQKFLGVVAIALVASFAVAQQGGRGQGRGFGQGRGQGELQLLQRKDVQADLGLTSDQVDKLADMAEKARPQRGQGGGGQGGNGQGGERRQGGGQGGGQQMTDEERAKRAEEMRARRETQRKEILTIISEAQMKRVEEIGVQIQGNNAILQAEIQKALGMDDDQVAKVRELQSKQRDAMTSLFEKMRNQELSQEDFRATSQKNNEIMKVELGKILRKEQADKLKAMGGKAFKADEN
jgi:hypothetical protein